MKIKILSPEVVDQIAAGEVVERPAHLVKELVENSLDAEATKIEVDVDQGGRKIRVTDNGSGIYLEDLPYVCARHATSKISQAEDLWKLGTYGFRGEALASIASVSRLKLTSKRKGADQAYLYENTFGASGKALPSGGEVGTTIEIEDLFSNVPARLKFLKSDSAEVTQIKNVMKALALAYPQVEFKLKQQGKVVFFYSADKTWQERARKVLDVSELFSVINEYNGYRLEMCYSSPHVTTGTGKQIWIFVENRWVQDKTIQAAILGAYRSLLMHGEFPYVAIKIHAPHGEVDVNIHPTKSQVKFTDSSFIFKLVHNTLRAELEKAPWLKSMAAAAGAVANDRIAPSATSARPSLGFQAPVEEVNSLSFQGEDFQKVQYAKKQFQPEKMSLPSLEDYRAAGASRAPLTEPTRGVNLGGLEEYHSEPFASAPLTQQEGFWSRLQVLGQTHLTYILAEGHKSLFLIDQHAAHERVMFEKLMSQWKQGSFEVQAYLLPLSLNLAADQVDALLALKKDFEKMGLELDQAGPETLLVVSAPSFVSESAISKSLLEFAEEVTGTGGSFSFEKKIIDIFATMACHSVVRAGQALSMEEMQSLLQQMDEFTLSSYCPHGRNVFVEYSYTEIERDFGRIP